MLSVQPMSIPNIYTFLPKLCTPPPSSANRPPRIARTKVYAQPPTLSNPHVLRVAETVEDSITSSSASPPPPLQKLRDISSQSIVSTPWPSRKDEPFRFTDTSFMRNSNIQLVRPSSTRSLASLGVFADNLSPSLAIVDGYLVDSLSHLTEFPDEVFVGPLSRLNSEDVMGKVSKFISEDVMREDVVTAEAQICSSICSCFNN